MKKQFFGILLVGMTVCGAGIGWSGRQQASKQRSEAESRIGSLSRELTSTTEKVTDLRRDNLQLESRLARSLHQQGVYSNLWNSVAAELAKAERQNSPPSVGKASAISAPPDQETRNATLRTLTVEKIGLERKVEELRQEIGSLNARIQKAEQTLSVSEGDRERLQSELTQLTAEKMESERKFNDLAALKKQIQRIDSELATTRRMELAPRGPHGMDKMVALAKEGKSLTQPFPSEIAGASEHDGEVIVHPGDSLSRLARQFNTNVRAIKVANGLKADGIRVGQKLKIPGNSTTAGKEPNPIPLNLDPGIAAGRSVTMRDANR